MRAAVGQAGTFCGLLVVGLGAGANGHVHEIVPVAVDSGWVANEGQSRAVVYRTAIVEPGAGCLRLSFDVAQLGESPPGGQATTLRVTSLTDFGVQHLTARHLEQWRDTSAYFNGGALLVEVVADPGAEPSRIVATRAWAGFAALGDPGLPGICGTDDRVPSDDPRVARLRYPFYGVDGFCTCWMINDPNRCFLTAGHCCPECDDFTVEFNVPLNGMSFDCNIPAHSAIEDQYAVDFASVQELNSGTGDDWRYFGCFPNTETALTPFQAQGDAFVLEHSLPDRAGQQLRVTGHGFDTDTNLCATQQTATGPLLAVAADFLEYAVDARGGGNSGSPVIDEASGRAVAIHVDGGCPFSTANFGTATADADLQAALATPQGICVPPLTYVFPGGLPELIEPEGRRFIVELQATATGQPVPGSAEFFVDDGSGFMQASMVEQSPNVYFATFPPFDCGSTVNFFFRADGALNEGSFVASVPSPPFAPDRRE